MKKLLLILFVIGIAAGTSEATSKLKVKDIIGDWHYTVETYDGNLTGIIKFTKVKKELEGKVYADDGTVLKLSKIVIENNELLFEVQPEYDVFKIKLKFAEKKLKGTISTPDGDLTIILEKK